jgi:hypothetical protein
MTPRKVGWRDSERVDWLAVVLVPIRAGQGQDIEKLNLMLRASGAIRNGILFRRKAPTIENGTWDEVREPYSLRKIKMVRDNRQIRHATERDEGARAGACLQADRGDGAGLRIAALWVSIGVLVAGLIQALVMFTH